MIMAYRRRQGISKASTFKEEIHEQPSLLDSDENATNVNDPSHAPRLSSPSSFTPTSSSSSSLVAQAIKASAARRDPTLSFPFAKSSLAAEHEHHRSKSFDSSGDASKSGFWGVIAQKAKDILEDDNSSPQHDKLRSHSFNTFTPGARTQEGRTAGESRLKGSSPGDSNQSSGIWNPWQQSAQTENSQSIRETQLKASRDVAMATAAKAKLLLRELKTVKADLAFSKARCAQLEEENKLLRDREGREKGQNPADDDMIRLQLETLLAEKARLASENEVYSRENRFLREIVEYHQLTMQDVVYLDEGMEEVAELYPIDTTAGTAVPLVLSASSPRSSLASQAMQAKAIFYVPQQEEHGNNNTSEDEAPPSPSISLSVSKDEHAK